jgi:hypothetical protein
MEWTGMVSASAGTPPSAMRSTTVKLRSQRAPETCTDQPHDGCGMPPSAAAGTRAVTVRPEAWRRSATITRFAAGPSDSTAVRTGPG